MLPYCVTLLCENTLPSVERTRMAEHGSQMGGFGPPAYRPTAVWRAVPRVLEHHNKDHVQLIYRKDVGQ